MEVCLVRNVLPAEEMTRLSAYGSLSCEECAACIENEYREEMT